MEPKDSKTKKTNGGRKKNDWNKFVRKGEQDDEVDMFFEDDFDDNSVLLTDVSDLVFLDSCASKRLFIVQDQSRLETFDHVIGAINLTKKHSSVATQGVGTYQEWTDITVCNDAVKNICSGGILRSMGYGLQLLEVPEVVRLSDREPILRGEYAENGIPFVELTELLHLPNLTKETGAQDGQVMLSDNFEEDKLHLIHVRAGHAAKTKLLEAFRLTLVEGTGLCRKYLSKKFRLKLKGHHLCASCARAKITRQSFQEQPVEVLMVMVFLQKLTADISVYVNCPSRQGFCYVLVFTDVATKHFWRYPLVTRTGLDVLRSITHLVEVELKKFPGNHKIQHYHADGGAELNDQRVKAYLLKTTGCRQDDLHLHGHARAQCCVRAQI